MENQTSSFRVFCSGYTSSEYDRIRDHLIPAGMNPVDQGAGSDIILDGTESTPDQFLEYVHKYRLNFPNAVLIRCVPSERNDNNPHFISSLFDGYIILDFTSSFWGDNMIATINQALYSRHSLRTSSGSGERVYQQIFYANAIPMALSTPESGLFVEVNDAFLHTLGYSREEVIGKTSSELNLFPEYNTRNEEVRRYDPHHPSRNRELMVRTKEGRFITGLFSIDHIMRDGKEMFLTTMKDISHQKEIERKLLSRNRFIQDIVSSIDEGIIVYDHDLRHRIWNRYMENLTGISEKEIIGKDSTDLIVDIKGDDVVSLLDRALLGITTSSADLCFQVPHTGRSGWVSVHYTPYRDPSDTIIGVIASVRDISARKKAEKEIETSKRLLRSVIDTVPVWIACLDAEGKILIANQAFVGGFGLTTDDIEGHSYDEFCQIPRFENHCELIKRSLSGRVIPFDEELEPTEKNNTRSFLRGRYSPLKDPDGKITGVVLVIIDISDLRQTQKALEKINSKLHLLSSITRHDILNSLTGVLGYLDFAEDDCDPDLLMTYVKKANHLAIKIREQIEFTRDYQDLGVKEPIWQNAKTVFTLAMHGVKLGELELQISLDTLLVYADPLLERVIYNLIDNALRYGGKITRISSTWYQNEDHVIWVVEDDGNGVPEIMKEQIFRKGVGKNTGLGLFLIREILDITGLHIRETGIEGKGARFEIIIPDGTWRRTGTDSR